MGRSLTMNNSASNQGTPFVTSTLPAKSPRHFHTHLDEKTYESVDRLVQRDRLTRAQFIRLASKAYELMFDRRPPGADAA